MRFLLSTLLLLLFAQLAISAGYSSTVDLLKLMGRWFEGIRSPDSTDEKCVVHEFESADENAFIIQRAFVKGPGAGRLNVVVGKAILKSTEEGLMKFESKYSDSPHSGQFWVYKVGPALRDKAGTWQYEYAVISNEVKYPVTVLVRNPATFKQRHENTVMQWLKDQGFIKGFVKHYCLIQAVDSYDNCSTSGFLP